MLWPKLLFSKKAVQKAGEILISGDYEYDEFSKAVEIMVNWRACHGYPVNTFNSTLRDKLDRLTNDYLVAQRLKRLPSIIYKLHRNPKMSLARMQDIGGLRAVVDSIECAEKLRESYRKSRFQHELEADTDYVERPKASGYRGFHLIYKYRGSQCKDYDGLRVELQIRTKVQHAWATAVETAGTFLNQSLKSSEGADDWLKFFSIVSAGFSFEEGCPIGETWSSYSRSQIIDLIRLSAEDLGVHDKLSAFSLALHVSNQYENQGSCYYLIVLEPDKQEVTIKSYSRSRLDEANADYSKEEDELKEKSSKQVVLVSASSLDQLRKAYPNYFLDTEEFLNILKRLTTGN